MSFDLDRLLKSKNLKVTTGHYPDISAGCETKITLWQDSSGPLRLSRIGPANSAYYRLNLDDNVAVDILPNRQLRILASPEIPKFTIEHFIADQVLPRLISHDGELVLHSGAVRIGDGAILILGASGRGKSTLSISLHYDGWPLMGDDAVIISSSQTPPSAKALYPSLRLFADSIAALLPDDIACEETAHYSDKQKLLVPSIQDFKSAPAPIKAIYVLGQPSAAEISVTELSIADACMAIVENSFALDPTDTKRAQQRLEAASDVARKVPAFTISYPRDYACLPDVRSAILTQLI